jgi:hypothetical protein
MTITLNNHEIHLPAYCVTDEGALFVCGTAKEHSYFGRGGREDNFEKLYVTVCANCGEWLD